MKRTTRNVKQKAWKYIDMFPKFVSIVKTGANRIPFSALKLSEDDGFVEGYDIQKIVFGKAYNETVARMYLEDKGIVDYELTQQDDGLLFIESSNEFTDIKKISLNDMDIFVGKTDTATKQIKTKIISEEPIMQLDDENKEDEVVTVDTSKEPNADTAKLEDTQIDEPVVDEHADELGVESNIEPDTNSTIVTDKPETVEGDVKLEDKVAEDEFVSVELANSYISDLKAHAAYATVDSFIYTLRRNLIQLLEKGENLSDGIKGEVDTFATAVVSAFVAVKGIPDEDTVALSDEPTGENAVDSTDENSTDKDIITKLSELIDQKLQSLAETAKDVVDKEQVMLQTSKSDAGAFDVSQASDDTKPQKTQVSTNTKNLFGL